MAPSTTRPRPATETLSRLRTGLLIREVRGYAGLTQQELAERLGTSQSAISTWERGGDTPRVDTLARILKACDFEADIVLRHRDDVDQSQLAMHLAMTPTQRAAHHRSGAHAIARARAAVRVPAHA